MIISGKIDVSKIVQEKLFKGAKGTYLDITIVTGDKPDEYGNDGRISQDFGKEARAKKEYGPILGNVRIVAGDKPKQQAAPKQASTAAETNAADDSLPF